MTKNLNHTCRQVKRMKHMRVNRREGEVIKLQLLLGKEDTALERGTTRQGQVSWRCCSLFNYLNKQQAQTNPKPYFSVSFLVLYSFLRTAQFHSCL